MAGLHLCGPKAAGYAAAGFRPAALTTCFDANSLLGKVFVVLSAVPVATNATMLSIEYGGNQKLVAQGIFFSTVISVLTIPLLVFLLY